MLDSRWIPFLTKPLSQLEIPSDYDFDNDSSDYFFSSPLADLIAEAEATETYVNHICGKISRKERINRSREHKKRDVDKVAVPANVPYSWFGTHEKKTKTRMSHNDICRARRADRLYKTRTFTFNAAKTMYDKKNSRAHKKHRDARAERDRPINDD